MRQYLLGRASERKKKLSKERIMNNENESLPFNFPCICVDEITPTKY